MERTEKLEKTDKSKAQDNSNKTLYELVTIQGYNFRQVIPYLAESFGVCTKDEYNNALKNSKDLNYKYNVAIREQLLLQGGKIQPMGLNKEKLGLFPVDKQAIINASFGASTKHPGFVAYINGLSKDQISTLSNMSSEKFEGFLLQQASKTDKIAATSDNVDKLTLEQIKCVAKLETFEKDLAKCVKGYAELEAILLSETPNIEKKADEWYDKLSSAEKQQQLNTFGTAENAKRMRIAGEKGKLIYNHPATKDMNPEKKKELTKWMNDYRVYSESIGLGEQLKEMRGTIYDEIKNIAADFTESVTESPIDAMKDDIIKNESISTYFDDNMIKELVSEEDKDYEYYTGLVKLYPTLEKDTKIQELMNIENPTEQQKKDLMEIIKKKTESANAEGDLLEETKGVVKEQAVASCLDMLQMYMDIDLGEQENVLDQFKNVEHKIDTNVVLQINGKINGKNLKIYYDLTTGKLQQEEFLSKDTVNGPIAINNPTEGKKDIPGIQLPKFDDFITGAKSLDYKEIIQTASESEEDPMKAYKEQVASELKKNVKDTGTRDMDTEKTRFEKNIMKNLAAQEVFLFMEQNINESEKSFSSTNDEEVYNMYTLIYNSLELYTLDELTTFRKNITTLDAYKDKYMQYIKEKDTNKEKYILGMLGKGDVEHVEDKKSLKKDGDTQNEYTYLKKYADFFAIFKDTTYTLPIIDPIAFTKYTYHVGLEVSQDQAYLTRDDMKRNFNEVVGTEELPDIDEAYRTTA